MSLLDNKRARAWVIGIMLCLGAVLLVVSVHKAKELDEAIGVFVEDKFGDGEAKRDADKEIASLQEMVGKLKQVFGRIETRIYRVGNGRCIEVQTHILVAGEYREKGSVTTTQQEFACPESRDLTALPEFPPLGDSSGRDYADQAPQ